VSLRLLLPQNGKSEVLRGSLAPICGWVSRALDQREPAPTIVWKARLAGNSLLRTEIELPAPRRPD
jgi:hypothetical protein